MSHYRIPSANLRAILGPLTADAPDLSILHQDDSFGRLNLRVDFVGGRTQHITGDGNCAFRAVSHATYGNEAAHPMYRALAVGHVVGNVALHDFFSGGFNRRQYISEMLIPCSPDQTVEETDVGGLRKLK